MTIAQLHDSNAHPPCPPHHEIVAITVPVDRTQLTVHDRVSLRIGLWLLLRAQRGERIPPQKQDTVRAAFSPNRRSTEHEALTLLTYHLQRQLY